MASDYKKIAEEHRVGYGSFTEYRSFFYEQLYNEKTHFVYELIQNADDNESGHLELQLGENSLLVWNDGYQFSEEDVRSICSLGLSNKDLTRIGTFGIGFKSVYNYTDLPEIYSGDERFLIRHLTEPEGIEDMDPKIAALVEMGKTVFHLPFKEDESREDDIMRLKEWLCNLEDKRALLFLRNLKTVQWSDKRDEQTGYYSCNRERHTHMRNAHSVELAMPLNGKNQLSETFLVFRKDLQPPQEVLKELNRKAKNDKEQQRIQESGKKKQPIEVAFKLEDSRIIEMKDCVLFAYLPTRIRTGLRFIIQARYQTTLARNDIQMDTAWNGWLMRETAKFLPGVLEQLKVGGLLEPTFFNVVPLKTDPVPAEFVLIVEALKEAMRDHPFVPTQKKGYYAKAEKVFYPDSTPLRKLVKSSGMYCNSSLLHPDIQDNGKFSRCFKVMREAGVEVIGISRMLSWLEGRSIKWFEARSNGWLCSLYTYLKEQKSQLKRIKKLPLVRLENGQHVCASDQLVFFPPDTDKDREEIKPFLNDLPILQSVLLESKERNEIEAFLKTLGVRALQPEEMISKWIIPRYSRPDQSSVEQNCLYIRYLFRVWDKLSIEESRNLKEKISETPILRAYNDVQPEVFDFAKPCDAYLPKAYTGDTHLETYFSGYDGDIWFVDDAYIEDGSDREDWLQFLKEIGTLDVPRSVEENLSYSPDLYYDDFVHRSLHYDPKQRFLQALKKRKITLKHSTQRETIKDFDFHGMSKALDRIGKNSKVRLPRALWHLLVKIVSLLPSEESSRNTFFKKHFQGTYSWFYYSRKSDSFDAGFYRQLKNRAWIPDEQGDLHLPYECFVPTSENRKVLGDSVPYLHSDFDISIRPARWLAEKLGIKLKADPDSVFSYLQSLSQSNAEVSVEKIESLYTFLSRQNKRGNEEFEQESLIFTSNPEPRWWRADEVFWEDESAVFGNARGYLKAHYSEDLKSFFTDSLGIAEHAAPLDYVRGIKDVALAGQSGVEIRERLKILYAHLWRSLQEGSNWQEDEEWKQMREGKYWLGKKGVEWDYFFLHELIWKDDDYRSRLFKDKIPFWAFDNDLLELAKHLNVKGCYQASNVEFDYYGDQGEYQIWSEKVQNLYPYIYDFLNSPRLCEGYREEKFAEILEQLSIRRSQRLEVRYRLDGVPLPDPNPRQSFLEKKKGILWLGLEEDEEAYPDLIGDALQDDFRIDQLREFVKDLLPAANLSKTALLNWKRRGFQPNLCLVPPESDSKEDEENSSESVDEKLPGETGGENDSETNNSEDETPTVHEDPETGNANDDSTENESETATYQPRPGGNRTRQRDGNRSSTPNRSRGTGYSDSGGGGGGEGEEHEGLKDYLADNPSELGAGLKLVKKEYTFKLGGRVDILLQDGSGNPVTVEVKPYILSGSNDEIWQAVRYKHVAAAEYGLRCDQVRSILAAPEIPDDVKAKCKQLGIEPFEKPEL